MRLTRSYSWRLLGFLVLIWMWSVTAGVGRAQTFRGAINGIVTDPSGAVVAGASVAAVNEATGVMLKAVSSSAGEFAFRDIPIGTYRVTVTANGFKTEDIKGVPV